MSQRWRILAVLFAARAAMAFQFQAVAALSPVMMDRFAVGLAETGLILGLYLAPGIAVALPGGALGQRFGDREVVAFGLGLMVLGGGLMAVGASWEAHLAGRLIAGTGGVLLNVLMTKMVVDWFKGLEIATAMGVFVNSWPVGIGAALVILPPAAEVAGYGGATWLVAGITAVALSAFLLFYRAPDQATGGGGLAWPRGAVLTAVLAAGAVWGLYNAALAMVFGFGTAVLTERGWALPEAGAATSLVLWVAALSIPLGGWFTDRTGRPGAVILGGAVGFALALWLARGEETSVATFAAIGLFAGAPAGAIMALPGRVLAPEEGAAGMGLFFTVYYVLLLILPWVVGLAAEAVGTAALAFDAGIVMLVLAAASLALYGYAARPARAEDPEGQT